MQYGIYHDHEDHRDRDLTWEPGDDATDAADAITSQQQEHINHEAVLVPLHRNPFQSNEEAIFFAGLQEVIVQDIMPDNFGLTLAKWDSDQYPVFETIHVGRCAAKDVDVLLAEPIWYTRARLWCQALSALSFYLLMRGA